MSKNNIELSSSSGSEYDEDYRINRLKKVLKLFTCQVQCFELNYYTQINKLHDHKGTLTITWQTTPQNEEKELFKFIWEINGELSENVEFEVSKN